MFALSMNLKCPVRRLVSKNDDKEVLVATKRKLFYDIYKQKLIISISFQS